MNGENGKRGKVLRKISSNKKKKRIIIGICAFIVIISALFTGYFLSINKIVEEWNNKIYLGVAVQDVNIGGMTKEEAREKLIQELQGKIGDKKVSIKIGESEFELLYSDISPVYDIDNVINDAMNFGKNDSVLKKYSYIKNKGKDKHEIDLNLSYDEEKLKAYEEMVKSKVEDEPKDATLSINGNGFSIVDEVVGKSINMDEFDKKLKEIITGHINEEIVVSMDLETVQPKITSKDLSKINGIIGSYSSNYGTSSEGRSANIDLATKAINGVILMPGDVFSFNEVVGPRTVERGYKEAATYVGNKVEPGIGGGICQVSTALYRAVMHANIRAVERRNHSMSVGYAKPGLDATVSYGDIDYKFKNTYDSPIYIQGSTYNKVMTYNIYGDVSALGGKTYDMENEIIQTIEPTVKVVEDATLPEGQEVTESGGMTGYKTNSYQLTYENGVQTNKELISNDYYTAVDIVVKKGTQPLVPPAATEQTPGVVPPANPPVTPPVSQDSVAPPVAQ
ncbi:MULTISPECIES: VanW family protein [Clostridium]|uniref:VanW family protein n=1 Tax=Clostridium aquiflavi TaxID=3073603 RepID=A0ABU1EG14_9CLOT|nr:VanW family protein [Clostridium sp. 5N-1]MDR5587328.1 VanW family protein [Clostridium sp. 5N-1]NFG61973.1 vanomycin resistance protein VanB [Clostridium botulinum]NFQ08359.1 vanomycin resistance protein VanB [Clostridium botulinum]